MLFERRLRSTCGSGAGRVAADIDWLVAQGVTVVRHNLSQDPQTFVSNSRVLDRMQREGAECLPIVLVNGEQLGHGVYPRREELARAAGLVADAELRAALLALPDVRDLHELHVWGMASSQTALTAHLVLEAPYDRPDALLRSATHLLEDRCKIRHVTLQLESTDCPSDGHCS